MRPELGFLIIAVLLLAWSLSRWTIRSRQARTRALRVTRDAMRAPDGAHDTGQAALREAEDRIPTIDERGNRYLLIRTRTMETVRGPVGPVEVERRCRLTLPGHGHVFAVSDTEFEVFHSRARLRIDAAAPQGRPGRSRGPVAANSSSSVGRAYTTGGQPTDGRPGSPACP